MTVANASTLLKLNASSPTTLISSINGAATVTYTPTSNVLLTLCGNQSGSASMTFNGASLVSGNSAQTNINFNINVGAGQTCTIVTTGLLGMIVSARKVD